MPYSEPLTRRTIRNQRRYVSGGKLGVVLRCSSLMAGVALNLEPGYGLSRRGGGQKQLWVCCRFCTKCSFIFLPIEVSERTAASHKSESIYFFSRL